MMPHRCHSGAEEAPMAFGGVSIVGREPG